MSQADSRFAHATTGRTIKALVEALEAAAVHVVAMGCTCTPEYRVSHDGHAPDCSGMSYAKPYFSLARRVRRRAGVLEGT